MYLKYIPVIGEMGNGNKINSLKENGLLRRNKFSGNEKPPLKGGGFKIFSTFQRFETFERLVIFFI